ncbi:MAG: DUF2344 domain-containing protein [Phycisphaerales bacterium]|nr:MAG: DUF2344 domain-containing protein [Phycisphaerales bacterium]
MGCSQTRETPGPDERQRWVFTYSVDGDLRFLSHRDTLRMFHRALARAALPVRYTEGFNPHPRVSIPLPLPVGMASNAESIVVEFEQPVVGEAVVGELDRQLPADIKMTGARHLKPGERLQPALARFRLDLGERSTTDVESRIRQILEAASLKVERASRKDGQVRAIDVRPYLADMHADGNSVEFGLRVSGGRTAKPAEIAQVLGFEPGSINHRIRRLEVYWEQAINGHTFS